MPIAHSFSALRRALALIALPFVTTLVGCGRGGDRAEPNTLRIEVAPLGLPDVDEAEWRVAVTAGGRTVWEQSSLLSSRYGDGRGALSYVGPCDASTPEHVVTLTLVRLVAGGSELAADDFVNPTPVSRVAQCVADADTRVAFDLTVVRDARQGFFDFAVQFDDIFCSAKADCLDASGAPLRLLHDDSGARAQTLVVGLACTAGPGQRTHLYMNDLVLRCPGRPDVVVDPGLGPGAIPVGGDPPHVFGAAIYRGEEALPGIDSCYWNAALGLELGALPPSCTLTLSATAAAQPLVANTTAPWTRWPIVTWSIPVSTGATPAALACTRHGLDQGDQGGQGAAVATVYSDFGPSGASFHRSLDCATGEVDAVDRCGNGVHDAGEACDPTLDESGDCGVCTCDRAPYLPDGVGGCDFCGDGRVQAGEQCETALDRGGQCSGACVCTGGYAALPDGGCGFCGDDVVDGPEACDGATDPDGRCQADCTCPGGYAASPSGVCSACGDGVHQPALEQCDPEIDLDHCQADCTCAAGTTPAGAGACGSDL